MTSDNKDPSMVRRRGGTVLIVLVLLGVALYLRSDGYLMPHLRGDQRFYIGSAMKLSREGIADYSLRGVDLRLRDEYFAYFEPASDGSHGNILRRMADNENRYYDVPLATTPPLLSYTLVLSHGVFAPGEPFAIPHRPWQYDNPRYTRWQYARAQFYALVVPQLSSLLLILVVFLLGRFLFGREAAVWAAALMVICPTDILCAQEVWADDLTALFVALSVLLYLQARQRGKILLSLLAGVSAGLAATAKPTGGFIVFAICLYQLWLVLRGPGNGRRNGRRNRRWWSRIADRYIVTFLLAGFVTLLPWYGLITATYGTPWYRGSAALLASESAWFHLLRERSPFIYLVNIPAQTPLFFLAFYVVIDLLRRPARLWQRGDHDGRAHHEKLLILFLWLAVFLYLNWGHKEERYLLPAIPAMALLSGWYIHRIRAKLDGRFGRHVGTIVVLLAIILCAIWSIPLAREVVVSDGALIRFPL